MFGRTLEDGKTEHYPTWIRRLSYGRKEDGNVSDECGNNDNGNRRKLCALRHLVLRYPSDHHQPTYLHNMSNSAVIYVCLQYTKYDSYHWCRTVFSCVL